MKITIWILAIGFTITTIFNLFILQKYKQLSGISTQISEAHNKTLKKEIILQENILTQYIAEGELCPDVNLKDPKTKQNKKISELIANDNPKLFFRFKETDCDACIQKALRLLKDIATEYPQLSITILSGYSNTRQFYAYANNENKSYEIYNITEFPITLEEQERPYFFILDNRLEIKSPHIFIQEDDYLSKEYLKCMIQKYNSVTK